MTHQAPSDLISSWLAFTSGEERAFTAIFAALWEDCYVYAFKVLGNGQDAQEVVQELFIRLWNKRESLREVSSPRAYVFGALKNSLLNFLAGRKLPLFALDTIRDEHGTMAAADPLQRKEERALLMHALEFLPDKTRQVIYLSHFEGLSTREIALQTGAAEQTVRNQLNIAIKKLHTILGKRWLLSILILRTILIHR